MYPGAVMSKEGKRYVIRFEDDESLKVKESDVIVCNFLPVGYDVMAADEEGGYVPAVITGTSDEGYEVELADKKKKFR